MTKFNRVANLDIRLSSGKPSFNYVGNLKIENLRIAFQIVKSMSWSTNTASIQIYNLQFEKRAKIKDYGDEVTINAGYKDDTEDQLCFVGDTTQVSHIFEAPEIITSLECGDGEKTINQKHLAISFGKKIQARTVIEQIAKTLDIDIVFFAPTKDLIYEQGFQFEGMVKNGLDKATKYLGLTWSIQNKNLYIIEENGTTGKPPFLISQNTGMVGVPERYTSKRRSLYKSAPNDGYKVKTLLRCDILPRDKVRIISEQLNLDDIFFVDKIKHTGDTFGSVWQSSLEVIRV